MTRATRNLLLHHFILGRFLPRPQIDITPRALFLPFPPTTTTRAARYRPFDSGHDEEELEEAREWYRTFNRSSLPAGTVTYSRAGGPGGQHVNKTESKATLSVSLATLLPSLPRLLHAGIRASRYYAARTDSLAFQAQSQRARAANVDENCAKLAEEVERVYRAAVPGEASIEKIKKYEHVTKAFHEKRIAEKKARSGKKQSRKGSIE